MQKKYSFTVFLLLMLISKMGFSEESLVIPTVTVTVEKSKAKKTVSIPETIRFTRQKIASTPEITLGGLLTNAQSMIRLSSNTGDSHQVALSLRGFGENAVANSLILVDGFPLTNFTLATPDFNAILLSDIDKIDIFQGSQGVLYGDQAVGGVLNITTRRPKAFFSDLMTSYGSYNSKFSNVIIGNQWSDNLFFKLSGFENQTRHYRDHNAHQDNGFAMQVGIDGTQDSLRVSHAFAENTTDFPGGLTEQQFIQDPAQATEYRNYAHYTSERYQLLHQHAFNNHCLIQTRMAYHDTQSDGFIFSPFHSDQSSISINPELTADVQHHKFILGYDWQNSDYQDESTQILSRAHSLQQDLYAQTVMPIIDHLSMTVGARTAWQQNSPEIQIGQPVSYTNHVFITEQGLVFHPDDAWTIFFRRSGNFRLPKANEQVWLPNDVTELKPQTGVSHEAGAAWENARQKIQFSVYRLALNNEIAFDSTQTPLQPFGATSNLDATLRDGISWSQHVDMTPTIGLYNQINYVNARFSAGQYTGHQIPAIPALSANAGIDDQFLPHWKAGYNIQYVGHSYALQDMANVGKKIPGYFISNAYLQYTVMNNLQLILNCNNLLNKRYPTHVMYNPVTQQNLYYPGEGRNFLLTAKMRLG